MAMSRAGRRRLILALVVCAGGAAVVGGYAFRQSQLRGNMERWLAEGTAAHDRGDYETALANLNEYISRDKENVEALLDFADARRRVPAEAGMHLSQARGITQTALAIVPDSVRGRRMLMQIYTDMGVVTETREAAESLLELVPNDIDAHRTRVDVLAGLGRDEETIAAAEQMAMAAPDDLTLQLDVFGILIVTDEGRERTARFVDSCRDRFAGSLGLALMDIAMLHAEIREMPPSAPERSAAMEKYTESVVSAAGLPAGSPKEARVYMNALLDLAARDGTYSELAEETLARYLQDSELADDMAAFEAERAWSRGDPGEAAQLLLSTFASVDEANDRLLGWLALCGVPESVTALDELERRSTPEAATWAALAQAQRRLAEEDHTGVVEALSGAGELDDDGVHLALYFRGGAELVAGETARAAGSWSRLLASAPSWTIATLELADAYFVLGRLADARTALMADRRAMTLNPELWARIEIAIDETGIDRTFEASRDSYVLTSDIVLRAGDDPVWVSLHALAALACDHHDEARSIVDSLLQMDVARSGHTAADLANRLETVDPGRARALRRALASATTDPATAFSLALAEYNAGNVDEGRALLVGGFASAPEGDTANWEVLLALYADVTGEPDAAETMYELSEKYADNLAVQRQVLDSVAVWRTPERLVPVIERLRTLTGEGGHQWRLYSLKRELAAMDTESEGAVEQAAQVQIRIADIIREDPSNVNALLIASDAAEISGDMQRAADFLLRAAEAEPRNTLLRMQLPDKLAAAGQVSAAIRSAEALPALTLRDPIRIRQRAELLQRFGRPDLARPDWERLAAAGDGAAAVRFAGTLAIAGQRERADAIVEDVLADTESGDIERLTAAEYFAGTGRIDRGLTLLRALPPEGVAGNRGTIIGRYLVDNVENLDGARRLESIAREEDDPEIWAAAAQAYLRLGLLDDARRLTDEGLAAHEESASLRAIRTTFDAVDAGERTATLALFRSNIMLIQSPDAVAIAGYIGDRLNGKINDAELVSALRQLSESEPGSLRTWRALTLALITAGRVDDAVTTLRDSMDALPSSIAAARFAARRFRQMGMPEDTLFAARQWSQRAGGAEMEADLLVALTLAELDRDREALAAISPWRDRIIAERERQPGEAFLLAGILAENGDSQGAMEVFEPVTTSSEGGLLRGLRLTRYFRNTTQAQAWLGRLEPLVVEAGNAQAAGMFCAEWWELARRSGETAFIESALGAMERMVTTPAGDQTEIRFMMAICQEQLGRDAEAIGLYREVLAAQPDLVSAKNNLAYRLLQSGGDAAEALQLAEEAVSTARADGTPPLQLQSLLDTHAQALMALERPADAAQVYMEALAADGAWAVGLVGLAEAQLAAGNPQAAKARLEALNLSTLPEGLSARAAAVAAALDE